MRFKTSQYLFSFSKLPAMVVLLETEGHLSAGDHNLHFLILLMDRSTTWHDA
jgi:hypothetical protein